VAAQAQLSTGQLEASPPTGPFSTAIVAGGSTNSKHRPNILIHEGLSRIRFGQLRGAVALDEAV
jgi:hypothetical protein